MTKPIEFRTRYGLTSNPFAASNTSPPVTNDKTVKEIDSQRTRIIDQNQYESRN